MGDQRRRIAGLVLVVALGIAACAEPRDNEPDTSTTSSSRASTSSPSATSSSPTTTPSEPASPSPSTSAGPSEDKEPSSTEVAWPKGKPVPHLFFHSLIVDPERAFDGDDRAQGYDDYMITVTEFERTLRDLLERDYVLIDPHDIATVGKDGRMRYRTLKLPEGKKPIIFSVDDVSYYDYMTGDGFADRLLLQDGRVRTQYTDASGRRHVGAHDVVPILDDFVEQHPEFSHDGAKGIIAMTGYDGVLGYDTSRRSEGESATLRQEQAKAKRVASAMKENGWTFASHSWGHISMGEASLAKIRTDQERWEAEVQPIVGETDMLIYPFGSDISGVPSYSGPTYRYLAKQDYDYFFGVDGSGPWQQLEGGYLRQARMNVDGILLRSNLSGASDSLEPFLDVKEVFDSARER